MPTGKRLIYWDSCVFLAWLKNEQSWGTEISSGIEEVIQGVEEGNIVLMTSTLTLTEVLKSFFTSAAKYNDFLAFLELPSVQVIAIDIRVAELAGEIRDFYEAQTPRVELFSPDCIHMATGILYNADEIQTLDGAGRRRRPAHMISLSKNVMAGKYTPIITPPFALTLPFPETTTNATEEAPQPIALPEPKAVEKRG